MTETTLTAEPSAFRVGAVFSRAFELLFSDFLKFCLLSAAAWSPMILVSIVSGAVVIAGRGTISAGGVAGVILAGLFSGALYVLSQAVVLYGAIERMRGNSFAIGASLRVGLVRFFPILGLLVCLGFGLMLGLMLLVVPGIILAMMWYVSMPVCVAEKQGPIASLSRSAELTKGNRWRIFGIALIMYFANSIVQAIVQYGLLALGGQAASGIGVLLWFVLESAFSSIVIAVVYHDLRVAREGIDVDRIAAVFD